MLTLLDLCQPALSKLYVLLTISLNIATDVYILLIPIPMLWGVRLKPVKKLGLTLLFSGGVFVMVAGLLRCVLILKVRSPDALGYSPHSLRQYLKRQCD